MVKYWEMKEILVSLLLWIGANSHYNTDVPTPTVIFMNEDKMKQMYYKGQEPIGELHGFYNLVATETKPPVPLLVIMSILAILGFITASKAQSQES